jgi:pseudaminic acid cytidylyltransferase
MKNAVVIIPARAGSKRIKKKNVRLFLKKPIISFPIKTAINSKIFSKIIVSTDSEKIGNIGKKYGATEIIYRPRHLSNDTAGTMGVIKHAINYLEEKNFNFDYVCCLYPVSVLLKPLDLINAYNLILKNKHSFIFSSLKYSHPIQRGFTSKKNKIKFFYKKGPLAKRTQDISETYHDAGQFYWGKKVNWKKLYSILSNNCGHYPMPDNRSVDIDNPSDWLKAEALYSYYFRKK